MRGPENPPENEPVFRVSHEEALTDPNSRPLYRSERIAAVKQGHPVLVLRGLIETEMPEENMGIGYDFYFGGVPRGRIKVIDEQFYGYRLEPDYSPENEIIQWGFKSEPMNNREPYETLARAEEELKAWAVETGLD